MTHIEANRVEGPAVLVKLQPANSSRQSSSSCVSYASWHTCRRCLPSQLSTQKGPAVGCTTVGCLRVQQCILPLSLEVPPSNLVTASKSSQAQGNSSAAEPTWPSLILTNGVHLSGFVRVSRVLLARAQERAGTFKRDVLFPLVTPVLLNLVALNRVVRGLRGESTATKSSGSSFCDAASLAICSDWD
jgi:hypothetical protein